MQMLMPMLFQDGMLLPLRTIEGGRKCEGLAWACPYLLNMHKLIITI